MRAASRRLARLVAFALAAVAAEAQPVAPSRLVEGRVVAMSGAQPRPVANAWVTLHRVGSDGAGPLDSVRTDARGAYAMRYRPFGVGDAIYFASTRYGGVAYFTRPLRGDAARGEDGELAVFDTTSAPVPTTVRGRHLIVAAPDTQGARAVIEVYEISNDSTVTRVDRETAARGTWSAPVPARAQGFAVREGEVPSDALVLAAGRAELRMPLAPGVKQITFSYTLDADAFPLEVVTDVPTQVFEVLVEDPRGVVRGPGVSPVGAVTVEGRAFKRFLGSDVASGARVIVDAPAPNPPWTRWVVPTLLVAIGLAMVAALARPRRRAARAAATVGVPAAPRAPSAIDGLARRIAALDDAFERRAAPSAEDRDAYERERAALKRQLAEALAAGGATR